MHDLVGEPLDSKARGHRTKTALVGKKKAGSTERASCYKWYHKIYFVLIRFDHNRSLGQRRKEAEGSSYIWSKVLPILFARAAHTICCRPQWVGRPRNLPGVSSACAIKTKQVARLAYPYLAQSYSENNNTVEVQ